MKPIPMPDSQSYKALRSLHAAGPSTKGGLIAICALLGMGRHGALVQIGRMRAAGWIVGESEITLSDMVRRHFESAALKAQASTALQITESRTVNVFKGSNQAYVESMRRAQSMIRPDALPIMSAKSRHA